MTEKEIVKQIIVSRQEQFPIDRILDREVLLPIKSGKIISVPGVRRCGKSSLLMLTVNKLLSEGVDRKKILYFNFDDERLLFDENNLDTIIAAYRELYPYIDIHEVYMFFDEIQMAEGWERFIRRIYEQVCSNIFITGSNSKMLSSEIATALRGRSLQYEEFPLSFAEACRFKGLDTSIYSESSQAKIIALFNQYIHWGGFPEVIMADETLRERILNEYFYVMLYKDFIERYNINPAKTAKYYIQRVMENITKPTSINKIYNELKSQGVSISKDKVYSLAEHCESIYLFLPLRKYSRSILKTSTSDTKYYCIDCGLRTITMKPHNDDNGKLLENAVFLHLHRNLSPGENLTYYNGKNECDFVVESFGEVSHLIQVSWDISNEETLRREVAGLKECASATGCDDMTIITSSEEDYIADEEKHIKVIPAWKWMLQGKQ